MGEGDFDSVELLGLGAAKRIAGDDALVNVSVETGTDSTGQPAYFFSYKVRKGKVFEYPPGLFRIRLLQNLHDELAARGDDHFPVIRTLVLSDWERRAIA